MSLKPDRWIIARCRIRDPLRVEDWQSSLSGFIIKTMHPDVTWGHIEEKAKPLTLVVIH